MPAPLATPTAYPPARRASLPGPPSPAPAGPSDSNTRPWRLRRVQQSYYDLYPEVRVLPNSIHTVRRLALAECGNPHTAPQDFAPAGVYYVCTAPPWHDASWTPRPGGDALARTRPAILPRDTVWAPGAVPGDEHDVPPTEYAKRWGLHPDAPAGRSRTSPTRSHTRVFEAGDVPGGVTGRFLMEYFDRKARAEGMDAGDWLEDAVPRKTMDELDRTYMRWLETVLDDEIWQGMIFSGLTMDELHASDIFNMNNSIDPSTLQGELHPLVQRERWISPYAEMGYGQSPDQPRWIYNIEGRQGEYDPKNNDEVWEAILPSLHLVSKVLQVQDTFLRSLLAFWSHGTISPLRDPRPEPDRSTSSLRQFRLRADADAPPAGSLGAYLLGDAGRFGDFRQRLWDMCLERVRLHIHGNMHGSWGLADSEEKGDPIVHIVLSAELIWPLLVRGFSRSEKMMASIFLANTILHEMAHAVNRVMLIFLAKPETLPGPTLAEEDMQLIRREKGHLVKFRSEPYFEDEGTNELGFAHTNWLFGGQLVPFTSTRDSVLSYYMHMYSVAVAMERYPFPRKFGVADCAITDKSMVYGDCILRDPAGDSNIMSVGVAQGAVAELFKEDTWRGVGVFGRDVLRSLATHHKQRTLAPTHDAMWSYGQIFDSGLDDASRDRLHGAMNRLRALGEGLALAYLTCLWGETRRFALARQRARDRRSALERAERQAAYKMVAFQIVGTEIRTLRLYDEARARRETRSLVPLVKAQRDVWLYLVERTADGKPPPGSEGANVGVNKFIDALRGIAATAGERLLSCLPDLYLFFVTEMQYLEYAIFDVYSMTPEDEAEMWLHHRDEWLERIERFVVALNVITSQLGQEQNRIAGARSHLIEFAEVTNQFTLLKRYITEDQRQHNPAFWREQFLCLSGQRSARKTPSRLWARAMRDRLAKMGGAARKQFEDAVGILKAANARGPRPLTQAPYENEPRVSERFREWNFRAPSEGVFADLVAQARVDPGVVTNFVATHLRDKIGIDPRDLDLGQRAVAYIVEQTVACIEVGHLINEADAEWKAWRLHFQRTDVQWRAEEAVRAAEEKYRTLARREYELRHLLGQGYTANPRTKLPLEKEIQGVVKMMKGRLEKWAMLARELDRVRHPEVVRQRIAHEERVLRDRVDSLLIAQQERLDRARAEFTRGMTLRPVRDGAPDRRWVGDPRPAGQAPLMQRAIAEKLAVGEKRPRDESDLDTDETSRDRKRQRSSEFVGNGASTVNTSRSTAIKDLLKNLPCLVRPIKVDGCVRALRDGGQFENPLGTGGLPEWRGPVGNVKVRGDGTAYDVVRAVGGEEQGYKKRDADTAYILPKGTVVALMEFAKGNLPTENVDPFDSEDFWSFPTWDAQQYMQWRSQGGAVSEESTLVSSEVVNG